MFYGGEIRTMDPTHPRATSIAIGSGKVLAIGGDELASYGGPTTQRIDLHGRTVTPGLIDAHCHLYGLGTDLESVSVRGLASAEATAKAAADAAKTLPASEWLIGRGWDQNRWPEAQWPTKGVLDAAISDRPVLLRRIDGHAIWVNSKALAAAGITAGVVDPPGGKILRDANNEPTGVLIDNAVDLVDAKVPAPTPEVRERRIRAAAKLAIAAGITGVHEMGIEDATADVYRKLAGAHELPLHVYAFLLGDPVHTSRLGTPPAPPTGRFTMRGVKFFADGALGSRGARLYAPYDDDAANQGLWVTQPNVLADAVDVAVANGWQVAVHAIGDAAVGSVIDAYALQEKKHPADRRLRIEHTQIIAPGDIARMMNAHAIASMQPSHATSDMPWAEQRIGASRLAGAYAWRTMLDKNIPLAFGSDFPVEEVPPLLGIYAAVTRQDAKGQPAGGWHPEQKLTLEEALAAFTSGAAYAAHEEDERGMLAVGRAADLTIFDGKLAPDASLLSRQIDYTIVDGEIVMKREAGSH